MISENEEEASFYCVVFEGRPLLWSQNYPEMFLIHLQLYTKLQFLKHLWEEVIPKFYKMKKILKNLQKRRRARFGDAKLVYSLYSALFSCVLYVLLICLSHHPSPYASYFVLSSRKLEPKVESCGRCCLLIFLFRFFFFFFFLVLPPPCHGALFYLCVSKTFRF